MWFQELSHRDSYARLLEYVLFWRNVNFRSLFWCNYDYCGTENKIVLSLHSSKIPFNYIIVSLCLSPTALNNTGLSYALLFYFFYAQNYTMIFYGMIST